MSTYNDYLQHYGIKGMKWGVRKKEDRNEQRRKRNEELAKRFDADAVEVQKYLDRTNKRLAAIPQKPKNPIALMHKNSLERDVQRYEREVSRLRTDAELKRQGKMTTGQRRLAIGAGIAATTLAAYGAYVLVDSGEANRLIMNAKNLVNGIEGAGWKPSTINGRNLNADQIRDFVLPTINQSRIVGGSVNCRRSTYAYEIARRGYDVQATGTVTGRGQTVSGLYNAINNDGKARGTGLLASVIRSTKEVATDVYEQEGAFTKFVKDYTNGVDDITSSIASHLKERDSDKRGANNAAAIFKQITNYPDGARGELGVQWNAGSGHSMAWEIIKGQPFVLDAQTNKMYSEADFIKMAANVKSAGLTRLDNVDLNMEFLKRWVK